jgi:hypothetical protein
MNDRTTMLSPKLLIGLLALGLFLLIFGELYYSSGRGAVGTFGGTLPTVTGLMLLVLDGVLAVIWYVRERTPSSLE